MRDDSDWPVSRDWYGLVEEIAQLEALIREAGEPEGHEQAWVLHLLQARLRCKRRSLQGIDAGLMPSPPGSHCRGWPACLNGPDFHCQWPGVG